MLRGSSAQGNAHCAKFESHTNRVTFETKAIRMTPSVQAHIFLNKTRPASFNCKIKNALMLLIDHFTTYFGSEWKN